MSGEMIRVGAVDISIGAPLPWALYDATGRLVLEQGMLVKSEGQLSSWLERGLYRKKYRPAPSRPLAAAATSKRKPERYNPFIHLEDIQQGLEQAFASRHDDLLKTIARIEKLAEEIHRLCAKEPDAAIFFVHLSEDCCYTVRHPVQVAIVANLIAARMEMAPRERKTLIKAVLTSNLSIVELQEQLYSQQDPLTPEQSAAIQAHPEASAAMLQTCGVTDPQWLAAVRQHHENCEGSGYPAGLGKDDILIEAQIMNLADTYCAMISSRSYRERLPSKDALRNFLMFKGEKHDETLCLALIKELTVFPPGTVLQLDNGEVAVSIRRTENPVAPIVSAILNTSGDKYLRPFKRDTGQDEFTIQKTARLPDGMVSILPHIWMAREAQ